MCVIFYLFSPTRSKLYEGKEHFSFPGWISICHIVGMQQIYVGWMTIWMSILLFFFSPTNIMLKRVFHKCRHYARYIPTIDSEHHLLLSFANLIDTALHENYWLQHPVLASSSGRSSLNPIKHCLSKLCLTWKVFLMRTFLPIVISNSLEVV